MASALPVMLLACPAVLPDDFHVVPDGGGADVVLAEGGDGRGDAGDVTLAVDTSPENADAGALESGALDTGAADVGPNETGVADTAVVVDASIADTSAADTALADTSVTGMTDVTESTDAGDAVAEASYDSASDTDTSMSDATASTDAGDAVAESSSDSASDTSMADAADGAVVCGSFEQPCCSGNVCNANLTCVQGTNGGSCGCGDYGQACCVGKPYQCFGGIPCQGGACL